MARRGWAEFTSGELGSDVDAVDAGGTDAGRADPVVCPAATVEAVLTAVQTLADAASNAAYRRAIKDLELPTWRRFADDVERWIGSVLTDTDRSGADVRTVGRGS